MIETNKIKTLVLSLLENNEFLVDIKVSKSNEIFVYVDGFDDFGIKQCQRISHSIESSLNRDVEDFEITVSTPGLESNFKTIEQYKKNIGKEIEIIPEDGGKLIGKLVNIYDNDIEISYRKNKKDISEKILFDEIKKARPHLKF